MSGGARRLEPPALIDVTRRDGLTAGVARSSARYSSGGCVSQSWQATLHSTGSRPTSRAARHERRVLRAVRRPRPPDRDARAALGTGRSQPRVGGEPAVDVAVLAPSPGTAYADRVGALEHEAGRDRRPGRTRGSARRARAGPASARVGSNAQRVTASTICRATPRPRASREDPVADLGDQVVGVDREQADVADHPPVVAVDRVHVAWVPSDQSAPSRTRPRRSRGRGSRGSGSSGVRRGR